MCGCLLTGVGARAFLWHKAGMRGQITARLHPRPGWPPVSPTSQQKQLGMRRRVSYRRGEEAGKTSPLQWLRAICCTADHMEGRCGGRGGGAPLISVPAFYLCHGAKMWVSLGNTLKPRPSERIMTSCCVGKGLHIDKVANGNAATGRSRSHLCTTQWLGCIHEV